MTTTFEETLAKIKGQASVLGKLDERAVELGVILPLLKQLGWDTADLTQIYPQKPVTGGGRVDYDLQIDSASRVFIEVKRWGHPLNDEDEEQLRDYCLAGKPSIAVLTNGREWRLYLPPLRKQPRELRHFRSVNIIHEPWEVEKNFRHFLARDKMLTASAEKKVIADAKAEFRKRQENDAVMQGLSEAWNELTTDANKLAETLIKLAESSDIQPDMGQAIQFINSMGPLVNPPEASKPKGQKQVQKHTKPASFTVQKVGEEPIHEAVKDWTGVRLGVCKLMLMRNDEGFRQFVSQKPDWFFDAPGQYRREIDQTGIFIPTGGVRQSIKKICHEILAEFGYPQGSLEIQMKSS